MSFPEIYAECRLEFMAQTLPVQRFTRNFVRRFCKEEIEEIISLNPDLFETMGVEKAFRFVIQFNLQKALEDEFDR